LELTLFNRFSIDDIKPQTGKVAVVTGGSEGKFNVNTADYAFVLRRLF